jgi:hypothetical protein
MRIGLDIGNPVRRATIAEGKERTRSGLGGLLGDLAALPSAKGADRSRLCRVKLGLELRQSSGSKRGCPYST